MNKNSNTYIIIYSTVMVVVVAILLAVAALSLQDLQYKNELNEKKTNILQALGAAEGANFDQLVKAYVVENGQQTETPAEDVFNMMKTNKDLRDNYKAGKLVLFTDNEGRVVIPMVGMGLWGDIWGYIALEQDMNTVAGIVMAHKGETPGLGAEIATPKHQDLYKGKTIFEGDEFVGVTLRKGGAQNPAHEVDAISGGTKTSDGVSAMIKDCVGAYGSVLKTSPATDAVEPSAEACCAAQQTECETNNVENNE